MDVKKKIEAHTEITPKYLPGTTPPYPSSSPTLLIPCDLMIETAPMEVIKLALFPKYWFLQSVSPLISFFHDMTL